MTTPNHTIPFTSIIVNPRLRKDYGDIDELAESILENGLIQPLVVDSNNNLIAGGRRYAAIEKLRSQSFVNDEEEIDLGTVHFNRVPVFVRPILEGDNVTAIQLEVEENIRRKDMAWQEIVLGISQVHKARLHQAHLKSESWTQAATGHLLGVSKAYVTYCVQLADAIEAGDEEITKASQVSDAYSIILERARRKAEAELARRKQLGVLAMKKPGLTDEQVDKIVDELDKDYQYDQDSKAGEVYENAVAYEFAMSIVSEGDSIYGVLPTLSDESFNHVYTDIPYGIDMDNLELKAIEETAKEHDRDDNIAMFNDFLNESYRLIKPKGFCVFWCDIEHWGDLHELALEAGFNVQRWPLIWTKTTPCKNSAPAYNFTKNYEICMICRKDGATLVKPQSTSYFNATWETGERATYKHPFCKPHSLHKWVLESFTQDGDTILNPYCGEGTEILSCLRLGLNPRGYDLSPVHINRAREHIQQLCLNTPEILRRCSVS